MDQQAKWLREEKVSHLMEDKRRLVEVPYTASLSLTMNALLSNAVLALPVAAPPGHWIGAGGSMILESDKLTGVVRKHYIGMVTMLDILVHISEGDGADDLNERLSVPVHSVIGYCLEGLSLWTLNPNTSILDCMEVFSKGVHRALVPLDSHMDQITGVELEESSTGYRMLTQMDVLRFLKEHGTELKDIMSCSIGELGGINEDVFAVSKDIKVIEAMKLMRMASLNAVPIIDTSEVHGENHKLIRGRGMRPVGTFSATDLRGCPISQLQSWLSICVLEFVQKVSIGCTGAAADSGPSSRTLITCHSETSLGAIINRTIDGHVHRVWVVDQQGLLIGVVTLTDMLRVIRLSLLSAES